MEDLRHDYIQILVITALFEKQFIFHKFMLVQIKFFNCIYIEVLRRERMVSRRFWETRGYRVVRCDKSSISLSHVTMSGINDTFK